MVEYRILWSSLFNKCCDSRYVFAMNLGGEICMYLQLICTFRLTKKVVTSGTDVDFVTPQISSNIHFRS